MVLLKSTLCLSALALFGLTTTAAAQLPTKCAQGHAEAASGESELAFSPPLEAFQSNGVTLLANLPLSDFGATSGNDCWGYTSGSGREYAIMGLFASTSWVEITNPSAPVIIASHPGPGSSWHDHKVFEDHAYVVSEGGSGIQVFDMSAIDSGTVAYLGDVTTGGATNSHNVVIDEVSGYLYRVGTGSGMLIYDLNASKTSPPFVGSWGGPYIHDGQAYTYTSGPAAGKQIMYGCIEGSGMQVLDVTTKASVTSMGITSWLPRITLLPRWFHSDSCCEITGSWLIRALICSGPSTSFCLGKV